MRKSLKTLFILVSVPCRGRHNNIHSTARLLEQHTCIAIQKSVANSYLKQRDLLYFTLFDISLLLGAIRLTCDSMVWSEVWDKSYLQCLPRMANCASQCNLTPSLVHYSSQISCHYIHVHIGCEQSSIIHRNWSTRDWH